METKKSESDFYTRCWTQVKGMLSLRTQANHDVSGGEKKKGKNPLHSLLFVLPFAMHSLILAGMSPVEESSGPEEQNSR